ncbi:SUN domain-containing protein [Pseudoscourfieldia marina]
MSTSDVRMSPSFSCGFESGRVAFSSSKRLRSHGLCQLSPQTTRRLRLSRRVSFALIALIVASIGIIGSNSVVGAAATASSDGMIRIPTKEDVPAREDATTLVTTTAPAGHATANTANTASSSTSTSVATTTTTTTTTADADATTTTDAAANRMHPTHSSTAQQHQSLVSWRLWNNNWSNPTSTSEYNPKERTDISTNANSGDICVLEVDDDHRSHDDDDDDKISPPNVTDKTTTHDQKPVVDTPPSPPPPPPPPAQPTPPEELPTLQTQRGAPALQKDKRVNYASDKNGARVVATNPGARGAKGLVTENKDHYMITECSARQWFVVELSQEVHAEAVTLANYEFYSSTVRVFQVLGTQETPTYDDGVSVFTGQDDEVSSDDKATGLAAPGTEGGASSGKNNDKMLTASDRAEVWRREAGGGVEWIDMGTFEVEEGELHSPFSFSLTKPAWVRYIQVRVLEHEGTERFCTLSLIRVHGYNVVESLQREMETVNVPVTDAQPSTTEPEPEMVAVDATITDEGGVGAGGTPDWTTEESEALATAAASAAAAAAEAAAPSATAAATSASPGDDADAPIQNAAADPSTDAPIEDQAEMPVHDMSTVSPPPPPSLSMSPTPPADAAVDKTVAESPAQVSSAAPPAMAADSAERPVKSIEQAPSSPSTAPPTAASPSTMPGNNATSPEAASGAPPPNASTTGMNATVPNASLVNTSTSSTNSSNTTVAKNATAAAAATAATAVPTQPETKLSASSVTGTGGAGSVPSAGAMAAAAVAAGAGTKGGSMLSPNSHSPALLDLLVKKLRALEEKAAVASAKLVELDGATQSLAKTNARLEELQNTLSVADEERASMRREIRLWKARESALLSALLFSMAIAIVSCFWPRIAHSVT